MKNNSTADFLNAKDFKQKVITNAIKRNIERKRPSIDDVTFVDGAPLFSWVELNVNELCNRKCIFCPRSDKYPNQNLHMDISLAHLIAEQLSSLNFQGTVNISGTGEALLTRHLPSIIKPFGNKDIRVEIVTNGDKIKPKMIDDLFCAGLTQIVVSMYDGPEQIDHFKKLFKECGIPDDLYTLRDRWYDENENYGLLYTNRAGSMGEKISKVIDRPCYYPHYALYIDWNGDILLCCQDMYNRTIVFGNVKEKPIIEIWKDKKFNEFREKLKNSDRSLSPCSSCTANGLVFGKNHAKAW